MSFLGSSQLGSRSHSSVPLNWDQASGGTHAHEITDAEGRKVSSCCSRISKRFEKVWSPWRRTRTLNDHVLASLLLFRKCGASTSGEADSPSLAVSIEQFISKKMFPRSKCAIARLHWKLSKPRIYSTVSKLNQRRWSNRDRHSLIPIERDRGMTQLPKH